jgi:hypothetical protein
LNPEGQFFVNTVYLERGIPYFAFVSENAMLVGKIDKSQVNKKLLLHKRGSFHLLVDKKGGQRA